MSTRNMFLWRTGENYPIIITEYFSLSISLVLIGITSVRQFHWVPQHMFSWRNKKTGEMIPTSSHNICFPEKNITRYPSYLKKEFIRANVNSTKLCNSIRSFHLADTFYGICPLTAKVKTRMCWCAHSSDHSLSEHGPEGHFLIVMHIISIVYQPIL